MKHIVWSVLRKKDETIQRLWKMARPTESVVVAMRRAKRVILESNPSAEEIKSEEISIVTEENIQTTVVLVYSDAGNIAAVIERETNA